MHGRVDPNGACIILVSSCLSDPFTPPTDTTTLLVARHLLLKTLVAWQLLTNTHTHTIIHKRFGLVDLKHVMSPLGTTLDITTLWQLVSQIWVARYALVETRSDTRNTCLMAPCDTFEVSGNLNELKLYVFSSDDLLEEAWVRTVGQNLQCRNTTCSA